MTFVHLHVHSEYSFLDGACRLTDLVAKAKDLGMPALALTDHGAMYGALEFYVLARAAGIKPIIGCEIYVSPNFHLTLLAYNFEGYKNLVQLVTAAHLESFYYRPRVDKNLLARHAEGLIALSGCLSGEIPRLLSTGQKQRAQEVANEYRKIFGPANFYLELQDHGLPEQGTCNRMLVELGRSTGIPLVATNDVHYVEPSEAGVQEMMSRISSGSTGENKGKHPGLYLKSHVEMSRIFAAVPEAIAHTAEIAERCNLQLDLNTLRFPVFPGISQTQLSGQFNGQADRIGYKVNEREAVIKKFNIQDGLLRTLCHRNLPDKYHRVSGQVLERLEMELAIITQMKLSSYFLIVADIVNFARSRDIPVGPGRGSAGGSLVAYLLGITSIDPIHYGLFFERFLNPERSDLPDIDLDICQRRRDEVIRYVREKYGAENVAQIGIFSTFGARGAVREAGKALGIPPKVIELVASNLPRFSGPGGLEHSLSTLPEFGYIPVDQEPFRKLLREAKKMEGRIRHTSVHAAGIVISGGDLGKLVPLKRAPGGEVVTQYGPESIEVLGIIKIDILGLRNLTIIDDTTIFLNKTRGIHLTVEDIPLDDPATFRLLAQGDTLGCFQMESSGIRRLLKKLKPQNIEDLICLLALYRPGPWDAGLVETFLRRRRGEEPVIYAHPLLEPILKDTYGLILFQEQVMQIVHRLAGYSLGEADLFRRVLGKRSAAIRGEQERFIKGCLRNGIKSDVALQVFNLLSEFAGYSFNKAHSAAYALISYRTAFLKANYPLEYFAALLSSQTGYYGLGAYVEEARRKGIKILLPDINKSGALFTVEEGSIRTGFSVIKGVGFQSMLAVLKERQAGGPFKSFYNFCRRVDRRKINIRAMESLINVGAFDSFDLNRPQLQANLDGVLKELRRREHSNQRQLAFWDVGVWRDDSGFAFPLDMPDYNWQEKVKLEKELLGISLREHPLAEFRTFLQARKIRPLAEIVSLADGRPVTVAGIPVNCRRQPTRNNKYMLFMLLEDESGETEVVVSPSIYEKCLYEISPDGIIIRGKLVREGEESKVIAESIQALPGLEFDREISSDLNIDFGGART
ncbi:DNA polymerase III subunit alpha [Paradesulfitobacterium ferrireducens]|uniref:DNA polymerase III subunit alpha n=1 Tax=Paradesulfitobacterium ferrireducens TaxID=2816476 RepID=UPI001A8E56F3|nr:DNA polymerase III subunit alpha [Paradesulfitobacterium ferrireducens]